ncbi:MAG: iron-sulfur cluster assembly scaffold protein [bacterium]
MNYSATYVDHFQSPRNVGELENPSAKAEVEHQGGGCFDRLRVTLAVENGVIIKAMFKARACSGTIAAASAATEWAKGKSLIEAAELTAETLDNLLGGVPEKKRHSVELAAEGIHKAAQAATGE